MLLKSFFISFFILVCIICKAQHNEVVFKNLAAQLKRQVLLDKKNLSPLGVLSFFISATNSTFLGGDFKRSLHKLKEPIDSTILKEEYLVVNTLNYFFENYTIDSSMTDYAIKVQPYLTTLCNCLTEKGYVETYKDYRNTIYKNCLDDLSKADSSFWINTRTTNLLNNVNRWDEILIKQHETIFLLSKECVYYRNFVITAVLREWKKELALQERYK